MIFLLLAILLNTYVGIVFKFFEKFGINNLQAIVVNYWVCIITGCLMSNTTLWNADNFTQTYSPYAIVMGIAFFTVFIAISASTIKAGISTTQVANKLSLIIPVFMAWYLGGDKIGGLKTIGLIIALLAVIIATLSNKSNSKTNVGWLAIALPVFIFLGSGFLDSVTNFIQSNFLKSAKDSNIFIILSFFSAACLSSLVLIFISIKNKTGISKKAILGGIVLGIPNYFSILTLIYALQSKFLQASALIPICNIGVVLTSSFIAFLFFKEKINKQKFLGLGLAILSIILILLGDNV